MSDMTRKEAIKYLNFHNEKFFGGQSEALKIAISALSALSADVRENIHARWEDGHCSNCHVFIPDDLKTILRDYCDNDFCPNCGAIMDGEPKGEKGTI